MWRICRRCNVETKWTRAQRQFSKRCPWCEGDLVKHEEHPLTVGPILDQARQYLRRLEDGFVDPLRPLDREAIVRRLKLLKARIKRMELIAALAAIKAKATQQVQQSKASERCP